jgi:hypothetical protein
LAGDWWLAWTKNRAFILTICISVLPWAWVGWERARTAPPDLPYFAPHPQPETSITRILKRETALGLGSEFRGRVATLTGRILPQDVEVSVFTQWGTPDVLAMVATGNSHQAAGLWQDSIPTLLEYNPLQTPPYFVFTRQFFTEWKDVQVRNLVAMRRIEPRLLAAVGVRFVITDRPFDGLQLRQVVHVPVSQDFLTRAGIHAPIQDFDLYLYELNNPNLGQYSPTQVRTDRTASAMLGTLADPSVDLSRTLITADTVPQGLTEAKLEKFQIERGQFHVKAVSSGSSILVLPMEFSRCLHIARAAPDLKVVRLIRADLLMTGVLFEKSLDVTLFYRNGPFTNSNCRLEDAADMKAIEIGNAFEHHPEFMPKHVPNYEF